MSERQAGWYWVKVGGSWMVMECMGGLWIGPGDVMPHGEFDWMEIGPRIPTPDEPWQTVPVEPTTEMVEQSAQAIVSWDDGCTWPDSWGADAVRHRKDARKAYHAMLRAAPKPD